MIKKNKNINGLSLVEILVVISIFAVVGLLSTRSVFLTLRGAKKSDSLVRVRENVNYSLAIIERQLRSSESINSCGLLGTSAISYNTIDGVTSTFNCVAPSGSNSGYISSGSARLTSDEISVTSCSFSCSQVDINNPPVVKIVIEASDTESRAEEKGTVTAQTEIVIRNY